jgi:2-methylaconitate cis-trans-isomerase PrpF
MTWLRETPYSLCYYTLLERVRQIQGNDLGYSKNAKDWAIRRRVPKAAMIGHGTVSETAKALVFNDDLINLRMLKVQSILHRNMKCNYHRGGLAYSN